MTLLNLDASIVCEACAAEYAETFPHDDLSVLYRQHKAGIYNLRVGPNPGFPLVCRWHDTPIYKPTTTPTTTPTPASTIAQPQPPTSSGVGPAWRLAPCGALQSAALVAERA